MPLIKKRDKKKLGNKSPIAASNKRETEQKHEEESRTEKLSHKSPIAPSNKRETEQKQEEVSKTEITDLSVEDVEEAVKLINDIPAITSSVSDVIQNVAGRIENEELQTEKGLSFLDLKNLNMLNYITNLAYIILRKLNGKKIENDPAIKRLAELRVVMEKMRPIEDKLKYQITKLLASTSSENIDTNDPLKFRANPDSLVAQDEEEEGEEEDQNEGKQKDKIYLPPKISAAYFDEENKFEKRKRKVEHAEKRAWILNELREEYNTGPEEIKDTVDCKLKQELEDKERFEENYFSRLPLTKKQRHDMKQLSTVTNFDIGFDDFSVDGTANNMSSAKKKSKWKKGKFKNNKKKGFKRKH